MHKLLSTFGLIAGIILLLPLIGLLQACLLWLPWTMAGVGGKYFAFLPLVWQAPSLWDLFLLTWVGQLLRHLSIGGSKAK